MNFRKAMTLALVAAAGLSLSAGDLTANLRGGWGTKRQDGVKDSLGFGLGYSFELAKGTSLVTELSYTYQPGRGGNVAIPANSLGAHLDPNGTATDGTSTNFQKATNTILGYRVLARTAITDSWSFQGGLFMGRAKSRLEAVGDMRTAAVAGPPAVPSSVAGGWTITPERSSSFVSPVLGLVYNLGEVGYVEFNAVALSYDQTTVTPTQIPGATGTARIQPVVGSKGVTHVNLEIGVSFRF